MGRRGRNPGGPSGIPSCEGMAGSSIASCAAGACLILLPAGGGRRSLGLKSQARSSFLAATARAVLLVEASGLPWLDLPAAASAEPSVGLVRVALADFPALATVSASVHFLIAATRAIYPVILTRVATETFPTASTLRYEIKRRTSMTTPAATVFFSLTETGAATQTELTGNGATATLYVEAAAATGFLSVSRF